MFCVGMAGVWSVPKVTVIMGYAAAVNRECVDVSHLQHVTLNYNCIWNQKILFDPPPPILHINPYIAATLSAG